MARKHPLAECEKCPLQSKPCAPTQKPPQAVAAVVSRSPGYHEAMNGKPFSGPSGQVLDHLLKMNGVSRANVMVTNVVLCCLPEGSKEVPPEAIKACAPRLDAELNGIGTVIACGSEAVKLLIGRGSIDSHRGYIHTRSTNGSSASVVATNNPALVLRDSATFPNLKRDFKRAFHPDPPPTLPVVEVIEDESHAQQYIDSLREYKGAIACDVESRGGITHKASLISLQFSVDGVRAVVLGERQGLFDSEVFIRDYLRPLFESRSHDFIWHGGKFDIKILRHTYGINARVDQDTMLLSYALDERSGGDERVGVHGLDYLLMDTFAWPKYTNATIEKIKKTGMFMWPDVEKKIRAKFKEEEHADQAVIDAIARNYEQFYEYAGRDVGGTFQLFAEQQPRAEKDKVWDSYRHLLIRGTELAAQIEMYGMPYDSESAADIYEFEVGPEMDEITNAMREHADKPLLNPRSPTQLAHLFYDEWKINHAMRKRPEQSRSVDDSARQEILQDRFELQPRYHMVNGKATELADYKERKTSIKSFVTKYDRFQEIQKQASTYLLGMIARAELDPDSRIYTQLNFHGTNSGRLSSSKPNLQNITRSKEGLPDIRKLFTASPGRLIVSADYSQAELRCIAQFSGDTELNRIYRDNLSLHRETATRFYGPEYTGEQYSTCKNVNFGVFYQQSAETFQEKHGIPIHEAVPYIKWVWETFTGVAEWESGVGNEVRKKGVLVSPFGRKRRFHLLTKENINASIREGINFYPQSTASDLTLCAAIRLSGEIDATKAGLCILVHDSIVGDVDEGYIDEYKTICEQVMESTAEAELGWTLPFKVETGIGPNWGEAK
jgi:uracil-DNA glycosylase family 4